MFQIDVMSRVPVYEQLISQIEKLVLSGVLLPGTPLPSVRSLSTALSINPNTIQKAYSELNARGVLSSVPGRGAFICENIDRFRREKNQKKLQELEASLLELRQSGVAKEEILPLISAVYKEDAL
ncbi:MAG: GntR family transcriptional regulator [Lachnospiraceae bacterium]|nr:GntR family transcriptional regulator [Lachnospiraceae bacterium]